jgi:hypothetical protein
MVDGYVRIQRLKKRHAFMTTPLSTDEFRRHTSVSHFTPHVLVVQ